MRRGGGRRDIGLLSLMCFADFRPEEFKRKEESSEDDDEAAGEGEGVENTVV